MAQNTRRDDTHLAPGRPLNCLSTAVPGTRLGCSAMRTGTGSRVATSASIAVKSTPENPATSPTAPPDAKARMSSRWSAPCDAPASDKDAVARHPSATATPVAVNILNLSSPYSLRPSSRIFVLCSTVILKKPLGRSSRAASSGLVPPTQSSHGYVATAPRLRCSAATAIELPSLHRSSTSSTYHIPPSSGEIHIAAGRPRSGASNVTTSSAPRSNRGAL
mmetsp:Transcript_3564/g.13348  ORF Transcript_3564/g.13348 Transcript_3564/m.13348 type:complete len:220 (-) Transcript_3564:563-1222(-)